MKSREFYFSFQLVKNFREQIFCRECARNKLNSSIYFIIYLKLRHNTLPYNANKVASAVQSRWTKHSKGILHINLNFVCSSVETDLKVTSLHKRSTVQSSCRRNSMKILPLEIWKMTFSNISFNVIINNIATFLLLI